MAAPRKFMAKFAAVVLLLALISFFTCISLIDSSFFYYFWVPFLAIHHSFAAIIKYIHNREDKKRGEADTLSGSFLCVVYLGFSTGVSILFTSIVISLCSDPYCTQIRSTSTDPIIVYTILALFEYFNCNIFLNVLIDPNDDIHQIFRCHKCMTMIYFVYVLSFCTCHFCQVLMSHFTFSEANSNS